MKGQTMLYDNGVKSMIGVSSASLTVPKTRTSTGERVLELLRKTDKALGRVGSYTISVYGVRVSLR